MPFISSWRTDMSPDCERDDPSDEPGDVCSCGDFVIAGEKHTHTCETCGAECSRYAAYCSYPCKEAAAEREQWVSGSGR